MEKYFLITIGIFLAGILVYGIRYASIKKNQKDDADVSVFMKQGKKYKVWSIVNTCIFSVFILPILAIIESNNAQKATTQEEYDKHIRRAVMYNICTYILMIPFMILMKFLESKGMVNLQR